MATTKKKVGVWEWLSRAGNVIKVGGVATAAVGGIFTLAKSTAGLPILLTGIAVVALAILGCAVVLVRRSSGRVNSLRDERTFDHVPDRGVRRKRVQS